MTQRFAFVDGHRRKLCRRATINDGFLSAVFLGLAAHLHRLDESGWLRLAVPVNQRRSHGEIASAVNRCTMVFLDRHTRDVLQASEDERLASIATEMREVMQFDLGTGMQDVLRVVSALPAAMGYAVRDMRCAVTAVASNLGKLSDALATEVSEFGGPAGDVLGDEFDFLPPLRPGTNVSFGLATCRGQMHVSLHFDSRVLTRAEAETLLQSVGSVLRGFLTEACKRETSPSG